jgi:hypothetical protein
VKGVGAGAQEPGTLFEALAEELENLTDGTALTVAEFTSGGIVIWDVHRDPAGTPRARHWEPVPWTEFFDRDYPSRRRLGTVVRPRGGSRLVLVRSDLSGPYAGSAFGLAVDMYGETPAMDCPAPFADLMRRVLAEDRLTKAYELAALRQTQTGRLVFTLIPLFPPGAQRGDKKPFSIHCEPGDGYGTVFAVVAVDPAESIDKARLVSVQSASLPAGRHNVIAELRGPGLVRFDDLRATLRPDHRTWSQLVASVPSQLDPLHPAHLICAVEVSGTETQVQNRLDRVGQLIRAAARGAEGRLCVSLISYGPHAVHRGSPEEPAKVLTWAQSGAAALAELWRLEGRGAAGLGYPRAAQLECVLAEVASRLTGEEGRPVLVTVGSRPAFPPRLDPNTEIIPCPEKHDWRRTVHELLEQHRGIAFGAISDQGPDDEIWSSLGGHAFAPINAFDVRRFAARLGLVSANIPFPLVEPDESRVASGRGATEVRAETDSGEKLVRDLVGIYDIPGNASDRDFEPTRPSLPTESDQAAGDLGPGDIQLPHVPYQDDALSYPVTIYLSEAHLHIQVEEAVESLLAMAGLQIYSRDDPVSGSWSRRMWAAVGKESKATAAREAELRATRIKDPYLAFAHDAAITATLMANHEQVLDALAPAKDAVVRIGPVLIAKADGRVSIMEMTKAQQGMLDGQPDLATKPRQMISALSTRPADERMGDMESPYGGEG